MYTFLIYIKEIIYLLLVTEHNFLKLRFSCQIVTAINYLENIFLSYEVEFNPIEKKNCVACLLILKRSKF